MSNRNYLEMKSREEWNTISPLYTAKLVESKPKRIQDVIENAVRQTKYWNLFKDI